jgi:hypothetical protein
MKMPSLDTFHIPGLSQNPDGQFELSPAGALWLKRTMVGLMAMKLLTGCTEGDPEAFEEEAERLGDLFKCGLATADDTTLPLNLMVGENDHGVTVADFSEMDAPIPRIGIKGSGTWSIDFWGPQEIGELNFELTVDPAKVAVQEDDTGSTMEIPVSAEVEDKNGAIINVQATVILDTYFQPEEDEASTWLTVKSGLLVGKLDMALWEPPPASFQPENDRAPVIGIVPPPSPKGMRQSEEVPTGPALPTSMERCENRFGVSD